MNVYREAGLGAEVGTVQFNEWTSEQRGRFRELRQQLPDMDPKLFLATFQADMRKAPVDDKPGFSGGTHQDFVEGLAQ